MSLSCRKQPVQDNIDETSQSENRRRSSATQLTALVIANGNTPSLSSRSSLARKRFGAMYRECARGRNTLFSSDMRPHVNFTSMVCEYDDESGNCTMLIDQSNDDRSRDSPTIISYV